MPHLKITLISASDLAVSDFGFMGGKSDPYVVFRVAGQRKKSSCMKNNLNPKWTPNETFEFEVSESECKTGTLEVMVFDYDVVSADDLIGQSCMAMHRFLNSGEGMVENFPLSLPDEFAKQKVNSTIQLRIELSMKNDGVKLLKVWENQKWSPGSGWRDSEDGKWSCFNDPAKAGESFREIAEQAPPNYESAEWSFSTESGDAEGWLYATTKNGPWSNSGGPLCFFRRRMWQAKCHPKAEYF